MMEQLTFNAVVEGRFKDAAFYYTLLANEILKPRPKYVMVPINSNNSSGNNGNNNNNGGGGGREGREETKDGGGRMLSSSSSFSSSGGGGSNGNSPTGGGELVAIKLVSSLFGQLVS